MDTNNETQPRPSLNLKPLRNAILLMAAKTLVIMVGLNLFLKGRFPDVPPFTYGEIFMFLAAWDIFFSNRATLSRIELTTKDLSHKTVAYMRTRLIVDQSQLLHNENVRDYMLFKLQEKKEDQPNSNDSPL